MSTSTRRTHTQAMADALAFRAMFDGLYERWEIAGSLRRKKPEVGDVEHVVIPKLGPVEVQDGFFADVRTVNLLWHAMDAAIAAGMLTKHLYGDAQSTRWGEKYRGADFRGFNHEVFTADKENWGSVLAIRTGPAEFSQQTVTNLRKCGYCNDKGYVRTLIGETPGDVIIPTPDEESFFRKAGMRLIAPEDRR